MGRKLIAATVFAICLLMWSYNASAAQQKQLPLEILDMYGDSNMQYITAKDTKTGMQYIILWGYQRNGIAVIERKNLDGSYYTE